MFIVDIYHPYQQNKNVVYTAKIHEDLDLCVRELQDCYEWGQPIVEFPEQDWEDNYTRFVAYDTLEDAKRFINSLRENN